MIRKYRQTDLNDVLDAWYSASKIAHPFLNEDFLTREREMIATVYLPSPESETWVYEDAEKVVGFISILGNEIGGLFVHATHQRKGIGRKLMDFAVERTGSLTLEVFEENDIGRSFYEKYGFVKIGEVMDKEIGHNQFKMALKSS